LGAFFVQIFGAKLRFSLAPKIRTKNMRKKTLMKLTAGVDFTKLFSTIEKLPAHEKLVVQFHQCLKTPNFKLKLAHFLPNAVRRSPHLCAKKAVRLC